jgi:hypothetical protein
MSRERKPGEDTTPIAFGSIQVDLFVSGEEASLLDSLVEVERVETIATDVSDRVKMGLDAIKAGLDERYGDQLDVFIRARNDS